ncbi:MAG: cytochrome B [Chitinophagaceae bacterium]|nr:cytochrome B [Chitinophagaceae bacterium]
MNAILIFHSLLRWAVLLFGLWAIVNAIGGMSKKREYSAGDKRTGLFFMISCDIQLLLGLILYFNGMWFNLLKTNAKEVMKDGPSRFFAMEHILMMVIAWLLVHIGWSMVKRAETSTGKHKKSLVWFGIALLIILAMIPWPFRQLGIARELFPQF